MSLEFVNIALLPDVVVTALKVTLVVGTILAVINQGPEIVSGTLTRANIVQIALTYMVPYCVSTYSAVKAIQARNR